MMYIFFKNCATKGFNIVRKEIVKFRKVILSKTTFSKANSRSHFQKSYFHKQNSSYIQKSYKCSEK